MSLSSAIDKMGPEKGPKKGLVKGTKKEVAPEALKSPTVLQTQKSAEQVGSKPGSKTNISAQTPAKALSTNDKNNSSNDNISSDSPDTHRKQESSFLGKTLQKVSEHAVNVQKASTKKCSHTRSVLLEDGKIVVLDRANCMLKLISKSFTVLDSLNLKSIPQDITVSGAGEIAVAFNKEIDIYSLTTTENFQYTRKFYTREPITSIALLNDNLAILFVQKSGSSSDNSYENSADNYDITVQIRTFTSTILADKNNFVDGTGQTVNFLEPNSLQIRNNEDIIISEKRQFKVFDINGRLKWFCKFDLQHISGMTFDTEGNIYVCDKSTKKIRQVAAKGYWKNKVLALLTECPTTILFNPKDRTIVLGLEDTDSMYVYKFA